jgi:hypothetical protein
MSKIRKQIYLEPHHQALLKSLCEQTGHSEAHLIRQAIDQHLLQGVALPFSTPDLSTWEAEKAFIAALQLKPPTPGARNWCREDLYE